MCLGVISVLEEVLAWNPAPSRSFLRDVRTEGPWRPPREPGKGFVSTTYFIYTTQCSLPEHSAKCTNTVGNQ